MNPAFRRMARLLKATLFEWYFPGHRTSDRGGSFRTLRSDAPA